MAQNSKANSLSKRIKNSIKQIDNYGVPINLSYMNKHKYRTFPGGILTIFSRLTIVLFFVAQIPEIVNKNKTVTYKTIRVNVENDNDPYIFTLDNFDIAVRVFNPYGQLSQEMLNNRSKYFKFEFSSFDQYPEVIGNVTNVISKNSILELGPCSNERLGNLTDQTKGLQLTSQAWSCPKTINQKIVGSPFTRKRTTLKFRVVPCNQAKQAGIPDDGVTCASDQEIDKAIQSHFIQIIFMTQYFDENEFEGSPIKAEIKNVMQNIAPNTSFFKANLYQRVNITTKDSWFGGFVNNKQYSYLESVDLTNGITGYAKPGVHDMLTYIFSKYQREQIIVRKVTSIMDILSTTGGLSTFIMFVSILISKLFQNYKYEKSLIKKIFKEQDIHTANYRQTQDADQTKEGLAHFVWKIIQTRKKPSIFYRQYISESIQHILSCFLKKYRTKYQNHSKFEIYSKHLHSKMDIVALIKNVSQIKMILEMIFTNNHRKLIPYLNPNIINIKEEQLNGQFSERKHDANNNDQVFSIIQKLTQNLDKSKKDRLLMKYLLNMDIDKSNLQEQSSSSQALMMGQFKTVSSPAKAKTRNDINASMLSNDKQIAKSINDSKRTFLKTHNNYFND